jgi:hypothetical protein
MGGLKAPEVHSLSFSRRPPYRTAFIGKNTSQFLAYKKRIFGLIGVELAQKRRPSYGGRRFCAGYW